MNHICSISTINFMMITAKPIEGMYADITGDGVIDNNDRYRCKSPTPDWILGFSTNLTWKSGLWASVYEPISATMFITAML